MGKNLIKRKQLQNLQSGSRSLRATSLKRDESKVNKEPKVKPSQFKYKLNEYQSLQVGDTFTILGGVK